MNIDGIKHMTITQLQDEVYKGGKFVSYSYCFSFIFVSFKRPTQIYFLRSEQSRFLKGLPWSLLTLIVGWWGIPWGIVYTLDCLISNSTGGIDNTKAIIDLLHSDTEGHVFDFEKNI
jgi:hypothetical protein